MTAVFFDPGRNLGVLRVPLREKSVIAHGINLTTLKLRDTTDIGAWLRSSDEPIREWIRGASEVWAEKPNSRSSNHAAVAKNFALYGHLAYWCTFEGIPFRGWNVTEAKLAMTDSGNAKKERVIPAAEFYLGLPAGTLTEHEADVVAGFVVVSYGAPPNAGERAKAAVAKRRAAKLNGARLL